MAKLTDIAIIGPGKVGTALGVLAAGAGVRVTAVGARRAEQAHAAAERIGGDVRPCSPIEAAGAAGLGLLTGPVTAVALAAARRVGPASTDPLVVLATAHPAKFPDAVELATGVRPEPPPKLAGVMDRPEHYSVLPNDLEEVQNFIAGSTA